MARRFDRNDRGAKTAGVCTALAEPVDIDVTWIRVVRMLQVSGGGSAIPLVDPASQAPVRGAAALHGPRSALSGG
ncbi:MAG: PspC domain-containing protein [Candidatus Krumholzibacteriia bacterium]